jgi:hypothetical protein
MVGRTVLLILAALLGVLFVLSGTGIAIAMHAGYGVELRTLEFCAVSGTAALICLGVWLFLRAR